MIFTNIINGINSSAMLLLTALGLVIILGYMKVVNLAHTEVIMSGAYICYIVNTVFGLPFILAVIIAYILSAILGIFMEKLVIKKLYGKEAETLLATYALSIIIKQGIRLIFGADLKLVDIPFRGNIEIGKVVIPYYNIFIISVTIFVLLMTWFIFHRTYLGKKMRATTQNRAMTECLGIDTSKVDTWTFAHGMGLAGLAGAVVAPISSISPFMGASYLTDTFMNVVVGGVNSLLGTAFSSIVIGESISILGGIGNEINAKILVFLIVIVIIRFKPEGLFTNERR